MSPAAKRSKSRKSPKAKARAAPRKTATKPKAAKRAPTRKGAKPAAPERAHCIATDPFGDPCQSAPRRPSKYCTIHSYLDR